MFSKSVLTTALKLFLITAVSAFLLAAINKVTAPVIADNNAKMEVLAKQEVLSEAAEFLTSEIPGISEEGVTINSLSVGLKENGGEVCGYVVTATSDKGYGGNIKVMVGIDKDLKVTRVKIMESSETAGLGANASKPQFIQQFEGSSGRFEVVKGSAKANEISAIASATITSRAVTACVNGALEAAELKSQKAEVEETAKKLEEIKQETSIQISDEEGGNDN